MCNQDCFNMYIDKTRKKEQKEHLKWRAKLARINSGSTLKGPFISLIVIASENKEGISKRKVNIYGYIFS